VAHDTVIEVESPLELARLRQQDDPPPLYWRRRLQDLAEMLEHASRRGQAQLGSGVPAVTMVDHFTRDTNWVAGALRELSRLSGVGLGPEPPPEGWARLPAGPLRRLRANRLWLVQGVKAPWIVQDCTGSSLYAEVVIEAGSSARSEETLREAESGAVRKQRLAWVETRSSLLVRE
jgi:hypothetical protein